MWFKSGDERYNLNDFCHIWVEHSKSKEIYFIMGQWKHIGEEIVISEIEFKTKEEATIYMDYILGLSKWIYKAQGLEYSCNLIYRPKEEEKDDVV